MKYFSILIFLTAAAHAFAQQLPQYSQYQRNAVMINPGSVGAYDFTDITLGGRYQWMGFEHSPRTAYGYVSTTVGKKRGSYNPSLRTSRGPVASPKVGVGKLKHGVGGEVFLDEFGAFRKLSFSGTYAVHLPVSRSTNLSLGVKAGISNNQFFQDRAVVLSQMPGYSGTTLVDGTYDAFIANSSSLNSMDIGLGMFYYGEKFFVGLSADQLTRDLVTFGKGTADFNQQIHSKFIAGYEFQMNRDWTIQPSVLFKYMYPAPLSFDATVQFEYMDWIWFGLSYRNQDALIAMAGMNINERFKFGYSYDLTTSDLNSSSNGSHELVLGIMLGR